MRIKVELDSNYILVINVDPDLEIGSIRKGLDKEMKVSNHCVFLYKNRVILNKTLVKDIGMQEEETISLTDARNLVETSKGWVRKKSTCTVI